MENHRRRSRLWDRERPRRLARCRSISLGVIGIQSRGQGPGAFLSFGPNSVFTRSWRRIALSPNRRRTSKTLASLNSRVATAKTPTIHSGFRVSTNSPRIWVNLGSWKRVGRSGSRSSSRASASFCLSCQKSLLGSFNTKL